MGKWLTSVQTNEKKMWRKKKECKRRDHTLKNLILVAAFARFTQNYRTKDRNGAEQFEEISAFHD